MNDIYNINFSINLQLANYHNFIKNNHLIEDYQLLQKKYYLLFEKYLNNILIIDKIENTILQSKFFQVKKYFIQKKLGISNIKLNYFFIRNNLNIEYLSNEEMFILRNSKDILELLNLVEDTFLKVIKVNIFYGKKIFNSKILYDGTGIDNLKSNDSLILGFSYGLKDDLVSNEQLDDYIFEREKFKQKIFEKLKSSVETKLKCKIEFIEYLL